MPLTNAQYDSIMREYSRRQASHLAVLREHRQKVYADIGRIKTIDDEIASVSATRAKSAIKEALSKATPDLSAYKEEINALKKEKASLLLRYHYPADYMDMTYDCPLCKDTGYTQDGHMCKCLKQASLDMIYEQSGLRRILDRENFNILSYDFYSDAKNEAGITVKDNMQYIIDGCKAYVKDFPAHHGNLLFTGSTGTGKTYLSHCIAKALMDQLFSVVYMSSTKFFDTLSAEYFHSEEENTLDTETFILNCDLLIIDDLGTEMTNTFTNGRLFYCLNERMSRQKGTIISTNLSLGVLRDQYSERVFSRITNQFDTYQFFGDDIRVKMRYTNPRM